MTTNRYTIGTTAEPIYQRIGQTPYVDFIIQNLSANNLYFGEESDLSSATGIKIVSNGSLAKDAWQGNIWLIADNANSDVRISIQRYQLTQRKDP